MKQLFSNNAQTTLSADVVSGATSMTVADGTVFNTIGTGEFELATLVSAGGVKEIVKITARSGNTLTVVRGQESTSDTDWSSGASIYARITEETLEKFQAPFTLNSDSRSALLHYCYEALFISDEIDLTQTADDELWEIEFPAGVYFFPIEVAIIPTEIDTMTVQPQIACGDEVTTEAIVAQVALTTTTANNKRQIFTLVDSTVGEGGLTVSLKVAGTATTYTGRFYFRGIIHDTNG